MYSARIESFYDILSNIIENCHQDFEFIQLFYFDSRNARIIALLINMIYACSCTPNKTFTFKLTMIGMILIISLDNNKMSSEDIYRNIETMSILFMF